MDRSFKCLGSTTACSMTRAMAYENRRAGLIREHGARHISRILRLRKVEPGNPSCVKTPMLVITARRISMPTRRASPRYGTANEGVPAELLVFLENHGAQPKNSLQWHNTVSMAARWLKP